MICFQAVAMFLAGMCIGALAFCLGGGRWGRGMIRLVLPYPVSANRYWRVFGGGRCIRLRRAVIAMWCRSRREA